MRMIEKKNEMVTSLRVDPELWKEARIEAIRENITLGELVEEALKEWIKKQATKRG